MTLASAKQPPVDHAAEEPGAGGNLPARIDSAPTPPATFERLDAAPQDDAERFAFALWRAGRKQEAVEFLERQIARRGGDAALRALPTLDIAPAPVTFIPRRNSRRPAVAVAGGAVLALAVAVMWTGVDRIAALPAWINAAATQANDGAPDTPATDPASDRRALAANEEKVEIAAEDAPATTGAAVLAAGDTPPPGDVSSGVLETETATAAAENATEESATDAIETAAAETAAARVTPTPSPQPPAATGLARLAEAQDAAGPDQPADDIAASEPPPGPDAKPATFADTTPRSPAKLDAMPEGTEPVTLAALADRITGEARLPRPRPTPSPETVAAVSRPSAPERDPYYVVPEPEPYAEAPATPSPYVPAVPPSYAGGPRYVPYMSPPSYDTVVGGRRLTIIGRVNTPVVVYRQGPYGRRIYRYPAAPWGSTPLPWATAPQQPSDDFWRY
jgi:hypothetical protein